MAQADGYVYIDTKLDQSELNSGLGKMKSVVTAGVAAMVASMGALSVAVINVGSEYEDAAAKVSTLVDENVNSMDKISENILAVSSRTGQAASELAEATYQALSAGIKGTEDEITGFVEQSAKLAKAGFTSTASAVDIVTTAINGYGMTVDDAEGITNQLIMTQNLGKTTVDELSATLGRVIPTASAFSVSLGNVNTAMAIMTASGINTAESSTYLKSMLNELGDTGSDVAGILLEKTGKSFTELMDEGKSLGDVMAILGESVDNDSTAFANLWSSAEAGTGALTILNGGSEKYNDTLNQIENSTTAVDDAYKKVTDTFSEKSKKVQESLKNVGIDAYNKFEKPLKGAMDSAQDAVNELSKEMSNGKLGKSVDTIADGFADLVKIIIDLAKKTIPLLVNGFALIIDNADKITIALSAVGSAMLAYKTYTNVIQPVTKAWQAATIALQAHEAANRLTMVASAGTAGGMTLMQTAVGVLTGKITLATAAQGALNSVMAISPAGAFAIAVGAVTAGIAALAISMGDSKEEIDENVEATNKLIESQKELNDELKQSKEAREEVNAKAEEQVATADVLMKKIDDLANKENKSNAEKEIMASLVEELNGVMPDLNLQYDKEKDALNMSTDAIKANIEAQKDLILAKAAQENLAAIAQDIAKAEIENAKLVEQHTENEKALTKAKKNTTDAMKKWQDAGGEFSGELYQQWLEASRIEGNLQSAYNDSLGALEKNEKTLKRLNGEYDKTSKYAENMLDKGEMQKKLNALTEQAKAQGIDIPKAVSDGITEGNYAIPVSIEEMNALISFQSLRDKAKEAGVGLPESISEGIKSGELSPSEAVAQMNSLVSFSDLLLNSELSGQKVPNIVKEQIINGQLSPQQAIEVMQSWVNFNDMLTKAGLAGDAIPADIKQAILEGKMSPAEAIAELNRLVNEELDKQPPKSKEKGKTVGDGYTSGISEKDISAKAAGVLLATNAKAGMDSGDWASSGRNAGQGLARGMQEYGVLNGVKTAGATLANYALAGLRSAAGEHSPWKTTQKSGEFAAEGLALGIENNTDQAVNAMENLTDDLIDASDFQVKGPYDDLIKSFDPAFVTEQLDKIDAAIRASQAEYAMVANIAVQHEMAKIAQQNAFTDKIFKAALDGKIEVHVDLNAREVGIALAPIIAEELAFK